MTTLKPAREWARFRHNNINMRGTSIQQDEEFARAIQLDTLEAVREKLKAEFDDNGWAVQSIDAEIAKLNGGKQI